MSCELSSATGSCWHLDTIAVTAQSTGVTTWFFAGCWFDAAAAGCEALLQGSSQDVRQQLTQYKVGVEGVEFLQLMVHLSKVPVCLCVAAAAWLRAHYKLQQA